MFTGTLVSAENLPRVSFGFGGFGIIPV